MERRFYFNYKRGYKLFESYLNDKIKEGLLLKDIKNSFVGFDRVEPMSGKYKIWIKYWKTDDREGCKAKRLELMKSIEGTRWKLLFENNRFYYFFTEDSNDEFPLDRDVLEEEDNLKEGLIFTNNRIIGFLFYIAVFYFFGFTVKHWAKSMLLDDTMLLKWLMNLLVVVGLIVFWIKYGDVNLDKNDISYYYTDGRGVRKRLGFIMIWVLILGNLWGGQYILKDHRNSSKITYLDSENDMDVSIDDKMKYLKYIREKIDLDEEILGRKLFAENVEVESEETYAQKMMDIASHFDENDKAFWEESLEIEQSLLVPKHIQYEKKEDAGLSINTDMYKCLNSIVGRALYDDLYSHARGYIDHSDWFDYGKYEYRESTVRGLVFDANEQYIIPKKGGVFVLFRKGSDVCQMEIADSYGQLDAEKLAVEIEREVDLIVK